MPGRRPIFHALAARIRSEVATGRWPEGLPPERELATALEAGRPTVRKALAVLRAENFAPPRQPGRNGTILWVGGEGGHVVQEVVLAAAEAARARGRGLQAYRHELATDAVVADAALAVAIQPCAAVITHHSCLAAVLASAPATTPVVSLSVQALIGQRAAVHHVVADLVQASALAVRHLAALGHQRIGVICTGRSEEGRWGRAYPDLDVRIGWAGALGAVDLPLGPVVVPASDPAQAARQLAVWLKAAKPSALVLDMDWRIVAVTAACAQLGLRIPQDLSVVGLGDTPWAPMQQPGLTSVSFNVAALARQAVVLAGEPRPVQGEVWRPEPVLVMRGSVAAIS